jgi:hypothetical protein
MVDHLSYMSCASQLLLGQSPILLQAIGVPAYMATSGRNWPAPEQRRHPFNPHSDLRHTERPSSSSRNINRSMSDISPISPLYDGAGRSYLRRRDTRTSSNAHYQQRNSQSQPYNNYREPHQTYSPYREGVELRSAPSLVTTFPDQMGRTPMQSTPSWPMPSPSPSRFNQYHSYSNPVVSFSPISNNPYDAWQETPQRSRSHTYMTSPISYSYQQQPERETDATQEERRGYSASSAPGAMQSPRDATNQGISNNRRESEADGFTSPSEFALFVEATSSLNINSTSSLPWSHPPRPMPTSQRLAAPLPPLPRSHSSPAPVRRNPSNQPSRTQLLAEALNGLDDEGSRQESSSEDDELPDYAQSQAEAAARQRREAARRAQELDQMWSSARRRRG